MTGSGRNVPSEPVILCLEAAVFGRFCQTAGRDWLRLPFRSARIAVRFRFLLFLHKIQTG